jgi:GDP-D-mannose dehydratase
VLGWQSTIDFKSLVKEMVTSDLERTQDALTGQG